MKAILMAAGVGSRISRHIEGKPKCLLEVDGVSLIERTCNLLRKNGVTDISVAVGYKQDEIKSILKETVKYYFNPFYKQTNSIASLWFAMAELAEAEEIIILNADLYFEEEVLHKLLEVRDRDGKATLLADSSRIEEADYRFNYVGNHLVDYGKELSIEETTGEYVGIGLLSGYMITRFKKELLKLVEMENDVNLWWENVIYNMVPDKESIHVEDVIGTFWAEMDYIEDYNRTLNFVKTKQ
jgi:choline kinase